MSKNATSDTAPKGKTPQLPEGEAQHADHPENGAANAQRSEAAFPVVGIGASAGGLKALQDFFSGMPAHDDPNMAFVLVQHLDPTHNSMLSDVLRKYTRLPVQEVRDGMAVRPDNVYVIPPGRDMALLNGVLHLLEPIAPRGRRMSIDHFFRSLAQDQGERAVGIVLSGTGSDGTAGIRIIKGVGGMIMAQEPQTDEYEGMPRSAIATGLVDCILPPAKMIAQLMAYATRAMNKPSPTALAPSDQDDNVLQKVFLLLREQSGHDFSEYKSNTIRRRIIRRMALQNIHTVDEYVRFLRETPSEVQNLFQDLLISVTGFFRDPKAFAALEDKVIPEILQQKAPEDPIRIWSVGCATGEEAYSLAILLAEGLQSSRQSRQVQIFATDIDARAVATARIGHYPASIAPDVGEERLARFFTTESDAGPYVINKSIRDMVIFSEQNVIKDPPFSRLDLICCRNLLIYLRGELQKELITLFHYALNPNGFLFLGTSESVGQFGDYFFTLDRNSKLYQRKRDYRGVRRAMPLFSGQIRSRSGGTYPRPRESGPSAPYISMEELVRQSILQSVAPTAALVSAHGDILYLHGRTGMYLELTAGDVGNINILQIAREGLKQKLTMGLHKAVKSRESVRLVGLHVKTNGDTSRVDVSVHPVSADLARRARLEQSPKSEESLFLVILEPAHPTCTSSGKRRKAVSNADAVESPEDRIASLEEQLQAKQEYLRATLEELETSNEDLKSSFEEMQSINEELQSSNEELETSKEELQSTNEELSTVNTELQIKIQELTRTNNDMKNLLAGTEVGTVFVDMQLRIVRYTPTATEVLNLIEGDIGRPLNHVVSNLVDNVDLAAETRTVLDTLIPKEAEVQSSSEKYYLMTVRPYRTMENVIEGAVITFVDISKRKELEDALRRTKLREAQERLSEAIVATVREPLLVLDREMRVVYANRTFYREFRVSEDETHGKPLYELDSRQWDITELRGMLEGVRDRGEVFNDFAMPHEFKDIGSQIMRLNARRLVVEELDSPLILLALEKTPG